MIYLGCYLFIGLLLVIIKSPIRKLVDSEITKIEIHNAINDEEVSITKIVFLRIILSGALIIIYPLMLFAEFKEYSTRRDMVKKQWKVKDDAYKKWLQNEISIEEAEAKHLVKIENQNMPFGYMHSSWLNLLNKMQDGDKLHEYTSSDGSPENLTGQAGIALTRSGKIIGELATMMN